MSFNVSNSAQFPFKKSEKGPVLQQQWSEDAYLSELKEYTEAIKLYKSEQFSTQNVSSEGLEWHNIKLVSNQELVLMKAELRLKKSDCLFSVVQIEHYGLEYVYQILIGPFLMKIRVLNLNRDSDDADEDIGKQQIGAGGFGNVRAVRILNQEFAIKRIPFKFKMESSTGYDFEAESNEQYQLRRCLREFCMFKVCSLLGIGPRVVSSSYDLICFNNCIEFKMEMCEPIASSQFYANHQEVSLLQMRSELMGRLAKLHSLNIVHRDIKPENILYSNSRKAFLFGDFGMNVLLSQVFNERTLTKFAGTAQYCGSEMKTLLNGEKGYVNLYLNDYISLKTTLNCLEGHISKESSQISMNNMSYREESYDELSDFENFSIDHSNLTSATQTDISYPSTGHSLANFTTASTEAPKKLATSINHHESEIIYTLCRKVERNERLEQDNIWLEVESRLSQKESLDLLENVTLEIGAIFFLLRSKSYLPFKFRQWKNSSRHFGPSSQQTIRLIEELAKIIQAQPGAAPKGILEDIQEIKTEVHNKSQDFASCENEMKLYRILGHNLNYHWSFIDFLRKEIESKETYSKARKTQLHQRMTIICREYLFCAKSKELLEYQIKLINHLFSIYIGDTSIQQTAALKTNYHVEFCYNFLKETNELNYHDLGCYLMYNIEYKVSNGPQIKDLIGKMESFYDGSKEDEDLSIIIASLALKYMHIDKTYAEKAYEMIKIAISKSQETTASLLISIQAMIYFNSMKEYQQMRKMEADVMEWLIKTKGKILNWDLYNLIFYKVIGQSYIYTDIQKAERNLLIAYEQLIRCYSLKKYVQTTFDIINNLVYIEFGKKNYVRGRKYLRDLRVILEETDPMDNAKRKIYLYRLMVNMMLFQGINTEEDRTECREVIHSLIVSMSKQPSQAIISCSYALMTNVRNCSNIKAVHFIEKELFRSISHDHYLPIFRPLFLHLALSIGEYLFKTTKQYNECLKWLWSYIEEREKLPEHMNEYDYHVNNMFASLLMSCNSSRRAIIFLKKYIFHIPANFVKAKKKAFDIMYKASLRLGEKMGKYYYELIRNDYGMLFNKQCGTILAKEKSHLKRKLLKKWFQMV